MPVCFKRQVYHQRVLHVMSYLSETFTRERSVYRFRVTQRAVERSMLGITIRDIGPNEQIRQRARINDATHNFSEV